MRSKSLSVHAASIRRQRAVWMLPAAGAVAATLTLLPSAAKAVDGCVVMLCLAAPSWQSIPQCVAPVRQLFRDLARGRPFPSCAMAGAGNGSAHDFASAPGNCPPQYVRVLGNPNRPIYRCDFNGAISVQVSGTLFTRTWWSVAGDSVTEYTPAARAQLGTWNTRFDDDFARWLANQPPAPQ